MARGSVEQDFERRCAPSLDDLRLRDPGWPGGATLHFSGGCRPAVVGNSADAASEIPCGDSSGVVALRTISQMDGKRENREPRRKSVVAFQGHRSETAKPDQPHREIKQRQAFIIRLKLD